MITIRNGTPGTNMTEDDDRAILRESGRWEERALAIKEGALVVASYYGVAGATRDGKNNRETTTLKPDCFGGPLGLEVFHTSYART